MIISRFIPGNNLTNRNIVNHYTLTSQNLTSQEQRNNLNHIDLEGGGVEGETEDETIGDKIEEEGVRQGGHTIHDQNGDK